jgi:N-methylhydantoinase A
MEVAHGAYRIANSNMSRAISAVSSERGRDPRKFVLLVFGGAGALHGAEVARGLGMKQTVIAPYAGVFSAFGFTCADIERYWVRGFTRPWRREILSELSDIFNQLERKANTSASTWGMDGTEVQIDRFVDLRYYRQASELTIPFDSGEITTNMLETLRRDFNREHERTFGHCFPDSPIEVAGLRIVSKIEMPRPPIGGQSHRPVKIGSTPQTRRAYFGKEFGFIETRVLNETDLKPTPMVGPVLVDKYDTTIVVPPGCRIHAASNGCLIIETIGREG